MGLNTTAATAVVNTVLTAAFWNTEVRDAIDGIQAPWTAYTPALTAATTNPTLGTGSSATGSYLQVGKFVVATGRIAFGTSGVAAGSGRYSISLPPVTAVTSALSIGIGILTDASGPTTFGIFPRVATSSTFFMYLDNQTTGTFGCSSALPVVPAASDTYDYLVVYQAA